MGQPNDKMSAAFGEKLTKLRSEVGIANQGELAKLVGRSQQSVSRWEAGASRPKPDDIAKLAVLLNVGADELLVGAGYKLTRSAAGTITFEKPLPLENLPPDAFERFLRTVLEETDRSAVVKRAGQSGHKQNGIDLISTADGTIHTFQCKRVQTFGPADVRRAVAAHTITAHRNYLVLSRVASPQARAEIAIHPRWEILDKEDLSVMVRKLSHLAQDRIIDTYFPGKRFELFGRTGPGPWMALQSFFDPFEARDAAFSHDWVLEGRDAELKEFADALTDATTQVVLITAPGGFGKSRILKEGIGRFQKINPNVLMCFLSQTSSASAADLEGLGTGEKVIVVDDAHDRDDLGPLLEYAAGPSHRTRLVLASRPYGTDRIKRQAAVFGLSAQTEIAIQPLSKKDLLALAREVLKEFGVAEKWAPSVAAVAGQSPLITVMAARVIAKEPIPLALATSREELKNFVLGKFRKVVTGDLGSAGDQPIVAHLLNVLAIIQPFDTEEPDFNALIKSAVGIDEIISARLIKLLADGGVIFKRGRYFRLMPDVLGDYLIDQSCVDVNGKLTPLALTVFAESQNRATGRTLQNLGRLDWRRNEGDPSQSPLLEQVWRTLDNIPESWDRRLDAVYEVASYQPGQALAFVQRQLDRGRRYPEFAKILRRIAYSGVHFDDAAELLWLLGREDARPFGPNPEHPLRILAEVVAVEETKPFGISEKAFHFGMSLLGRDDAWTGAYTPLDVVAPMLRGDGMTTESDFRQVTMKPFIVRYETVEPLRSRLIDRLIELMSSPDALASQKAAAMIQNALRPPNPAFNHQVSDEVRTLYEKEFARTLRKVLKLVKDYVIQPPTAISLARAISWHAFYGRGSPSKLAKEILAAMPTDLGFRTWVALADGYGQVFLGPWNSDTWEADLGRWMGDLVTDLKTSHNDAERLRQFIEAALKGLASAGVVDNSSTVLISNLLQADPAFARAIIDNAFRNPYGHTVRFLSSGVTEVLSAEPDEGRGIVRRLLASEVPSLRLAAGSAYAGLRRNPDSADFHLLHNIVADNDSLVATAGVRASWGWQHADPLRMLAIVRRARVGESSRMADDLCMFLMGMQRRLLASMSAEDVGAFLDKLIYVPELDGHWTNEFLAYVSEHFAIDVAYFFFRRVERYSNEEWFNKSRPSNHGPWSQERLRFCESPDAAVVLDRTWAWFKRNEKAEYYFLYNAAHLFEAMFQGVDFLVRDMLDPKLSGATADDLRLITMLLRNAPPQFVFTNGSFVSRFLERCKIVGGDALDHAVSSLEASAVSGVRGGTPGEPFPQDLQMRRSAEDAMKAVSRLSPAYQLYVAIRDHARWNIDRQRRDAEAFEE